jgi:hypothetical protein
MFKMKSEESEATSHHTNNSDEIMNKTTESTNATNSGIAKVVHGFRVQIPPQHHQHHRTHRKRKRDARPVSSGHALSSSSSSSSDEDEDNNTQLSATAAAVAESAATTSQHVDKQHQSPGLKRKEPDRKDEKSSQENSEKFKGPQQQQPLHSQKQQQPDGWRVKLYRLNADGSWDDCGTGRILCLYKQPPKESSSNEKTPNASLSGDGWIYQELGEPTLCMHSEVASATGTTPVPRILLRTRILLREAYQRQGDNIVTWCEPYLEEGNPTQGVDLALSFQDNAGCLDIWRQITQVQSRAADLFRRGGGGDRPNSNSNHSSNLSNTANNNESSSKDNNAMHGAPIDGNSVTTKVSSMSDVAHAVAAAHHANLQRQQQQEMWVNVNSEVAQHHVDHQNSEEEHDHFEDAVSGMVAAYHDSNNTVQTAGSANNPANPQLPNPPTLGNLEEIADTIAAVQVGCIGMRENVLSRFLLL